MLRLLACTLAIGSVSWLPATAQQQRGGPSVQQRIPPNVLVIVLDDVGTDKLQLYEPGADPLTPRLAQLASDGILFRNYYTNPMCSTSRACLQTGRYAFRTGLGSIIDFGTACPDPSFPACALPLPQCFAPPPCPPPQCAADCCFKLDQEEVSLAELLKKGLAPARSYRCGAFGKWHLSYPGDLPGLDSHAVDSGYDRFAGMVANTDPGEHHFFWRKVTHSAGSAPISTTVGAASAYASASWSASVVREDAVSWINSQTRPFLAWVAFNPPHTPWQVPPLALVSPETAAELAALDPQGPGTPPRPGDQGHEAQNGVQRLLYYRAMLEAVDTEVGNLLDQIDRQKRANTLIFVISDNGTPKAVIEAPHDSDHGKSTVYQIGVRVPMIVSGPLVPPIPAGYPLDSWECDGLVGAVDLWRTIADVTGANESVAVQNLALSPAPQIDSQSFLSLIVDPASPGVRQLAFSQIFLRNGRTIDCLIAHARAMSNKEYRYIRDQDPKAGGVDCDLPTCNAAWVRTYRQGLYRVSDVDEADNLLDPITGELLIAPNDPEYPERQLHLDWLRNEMLSLSGD